MDSEAKYPIREVSLLTGVNPVTLRAWQRRYGLIKPARTDSGHRLYSEQDIELIRQILAWLDKGVSIGQVKSLLGNPQQQAPEDNWSQIQQELLSLAQNLKLGALDALLSETSRLYPAALWLRNIIEPWLELLAQSARPDQMIIEQAARRLLSSRLEKMISIQSGPRIALLQAGNINALQSQLARYELQSLECRCYDLGCSEPAQLKLIGERLPIQATVILLGSGLTANWFNSQQTELAKNVFYAGQVGLIYRDQQWLKRPFAETLTQLVKQHATAFGLV